MRRRSKLHLVRDKGRTAEPISTLSSDEQTHLLNLADVALHNKQEEDSRPVAGDRARGEHELLKRELKEAVERFSNKRDEVA